MTIFDHVEESKQLIIVLLNFGELDLSYQLENNYRIYFINGLNIFEKVLDDLIVQNPIVIIKYDSYISFLEIISYISSFQDKELQKETRKQFLTQHGVHNDDPPTKGQCDLPFVCRIIVVLSCKFDPVSVPFVKLQQFLRFVATLHGGAFMIIQQLDLPTTKLINESEFVNVVLSDNPIRMSIPRGWDSWNRIQILGKSHYDKQDLLTNDDDLNELLQKYTAFLQGNAKQLYELLHLQLPITTKEIYTPLTLSEIAQAIN